MSLAADGPRGRGLSLARKLLRLDWGLVLLVVALAGIGFLMLYSVAGGSTEPWARRQALRFGVGLALMVVIALIDIRFWRRMAPLAYAGALILLVAVEFVGETGMGAQRWLKLGPIRLQPSELMKIAIVMMLASYYGWLDRARVSRPIWIVPPLLLIALPVLMVLRQPDLGTAALIGAGATAVIFMAGVSWWYFLTAAASVAGAIWAVFASQGTGWQLLKDYQFRRIETFLNPAADPLGAGYHITQSKIAMGSGGLTGRGLLQGTQSRLNFLPEKHTDFIFTTLAEEFGAVGTFSLLALYGMVAVLCFAMMARNRDRFSALLIGGLTVTFFLYWAINIAMVTGLIPVVGVPLPMVSYGGSALLVLMIGFGLIQSAHVHRP